MRKLLKIAFVAVLLGVVLMIVAPRVWVKNKRSHFVQDGKVQSGPQLYFGIGDRLLLFPEQGSVAYVSSPAGAAGEVRVCEKRRFRHFKMLAFADVAGCKTVGREDTRRGEFSWAFTALDGRRYEVSWETDFRR